MTSRSNSQGLRGFRLTGFVAAYAVLLAVTVIAALTWDAGARISDARETVEVAAFEVPLAPAVQAAVGAAAGGGTFSGTITFDGTPPAPELIHKAGDPKVKDAAVCAATDMYNEDLVVNKDNKGIANVFLFLAKAPAGAKPPAPSEAEVVFDQKGCQFLPHGLSVQVGQVVLVKSGDPIPHNTHTNPVRNPGFNQVVPPNDRTGVPLKYTKPEKLPVKVVCDFHPWMSAYHVVLDHPWMAITDADGKFSIKDVPAGKHEFVIWHEKKGYLERKYDVEIKSGETKDVNLKFGAKKFAAFEGPRPKTVTVAY